jgi:hypothetical protein
MRPNWIKVVASLTALWMVVGGAIWWMKSRRPTPEQIEAFIEKNPLDGKSEADRKAIIEGVAKKVNGLDAETRRMARPGKRNEKLEAFWKSLNAAEKSHYFALVVPTGMKQMIERFNQLEPARRKREVERAIKNLREHADDEQPEDFDPAIAEKFVNEGLKAFYSDATIEAKMDAMPLLEELENSIKWRR